MTNTLLVVRHGETEWSRSGRHTGRTDLELTGAGCLQAEVLASRVRSLVPAPSLVLSSPLRRAAETCRLAGFGDLVQIDPDLVEWDYGSYEGLTTPEIREVRPGWNLWNDGVPGGETASEVGRRADRVIARARREPGDTVVFAHGHLLRVLAARWVGLPPVGGRVLALSPGGIGVLGWEREVPIVQLWNDPAVRV